MENGANQPNAATDAALSISSTTAAVPNPSPIAVIATLSQSLAHATDMTLTTSVQDSQVDISTTTSDTVQTLFSGGADMSASIIPQDSSMAESNQIMLAEPSISQLSSSSMATGPIADNVIPDI